MSSEKKAAASRRNGKSSRGPTSAEGKAKASGNATKHGILSERDLLPDEDQNLREALWAEHLVYFEPVGPVELGLTRRLLTLEWRALRAERPSCAVSTK